MGANSSWRFNFVLYDEKMYPVHKRTESGPEIVFHYFFKLQRLVLYLIIFVYTVLEYLHSVLV